MRLEVQLRDIWRAVFWDGITEHAAAVAIAKGRCRETPTMSNSFEFLVRDRPYPRDLRQVVDELVTAVAARRIREDVRSACRAVFERIREATKLRNRVVHDLWLSGGEREDGTSLGYVLSDPKKLAGYERTDLQVARDCHDELQRCQRDVRRMGWLLAQTEQLQGLGQGGGSIEALLKELDR